MRNLFRTIVLALALMGGMFSNETGGARAQDAAPAVPYFAYVLVLKDDGSSFKLFGDVRAPGGYPSVEACAANIAALVESAKQDVDDATESLFSRCSPNDVATETKFVTEMFAKAQPKPAPGPDDPNHPHNKI